jgi:hypothetical protein
MVTVPHYYPIITPTTIRFASAAFSMMSGISAAIAAVQHIDAVFSRDRTRAA